MDSRDQRLALARVGKIHWRFSNPCFDFRAVLVRLRWLAVDSLGAGRGFGLGSHTLKQDIRHAFPEGRFDLILCRKLVFTYFETSLQATIARCLARRLEAGGALLLGIHESLPASIPMLVQERPWLRRKRDE